MDTLQRTSHSPSSRGPSGTSSPTDQTSSLCAEDSRHMWLMNTRVSANSGVMQLARHSSALWSKAQMLLQDASYCCEPAINPGPSWGCRDHTWIPCSRIYCRVKGGKVLSHICRGTRFDSEELVLRQQQQSTEPFCKLGVCKPR